MFTPNYFALKDQLWDNEIAYYISHIYQLNGKQQQYQVDNPITLEKMNLIAEKQSCEAILQIAGHTIPKHRIEKLWSQHAVPNNGTEAEILGYRDALSLTYCNTGDFAVQWQDINQIYCTLYKFYPIIPPLLSKEMESVLETICNQYTYCRSQEWIDPLLIIPIVHLDLSFLRPYPAGNDLITWLLMRKLLDGSNVLVGRYISLEKILVCRQEEYHELMRKAWKGWNNSKNDPLPFTKFFLQFIYDAYLEWDARMMIATRKLSAEERVLQIVERMDEKFSRKDVEEMVPDLGRSSVGKALTGLVEKKKLEREGKGKKIRYRRK